MRTPETPAPAPAALFAALGDPTRLRLVVRLARGEALSIAQLASGNDLTRQAVTKHLRILQQAGLATVSRQGREQHWSLERQQLAEARAYLDRLGQQWDSALARLKLSVEEDRP